MVRAAFPAATATVPTTTIIPGRGPVQRAFFTQRELVMSGCDRIYATINERLIGRCIE